MYVPKLLKVYGVSISNILSKKSNNVENLVLLVSADVVMLSFKPEAHIIGVVLRNIMKL